MSFIDKVLEGRVLRVEKIVPGLLGGASTYLAFITGSRPVIIERYTVNSRLKAFTVAVHENEPIAGAQTIPPNRNRTFQLLATVPEVRVCADPVPDNAPLDPANGVFKSAMYDTGVVVPTDNQVIVLKAQTTYILQLRNEGANEMDDIHIAVEVDDLSVKVRM